MARRVLGVALAATLSASMLATPAQAPHASDGPRDAPTVAASIFADPSLITGAELEDDAIAILTDHAGVMSLAAPIGGFPIHGGSFGIVSTGDANSANDPDTAGNTSTSLPGANTNTGTDLSGLTIHFGTPAGFLAPCLQVQVKFLSEEFPEFVGSAFNDFVAGVVNDVTPPTVDGAGQPSAPGNFIQDSLGRPLTVNNNFQVSKAQAPATTFDGATPTLTARTPVPPGENTVTFWAADVGDSVWDSAMFLDNLQILNTEKCKAGTQAPGALQVKPKVNNNGAIVVKGKLVPPHPGMKVFIKLWAKNSPFKLVRKAKALINAAGKYKKLLNFPGERKKCRVSVRFKGDIDHFPASAKKVFKC